MLWTRSGPPTPWPVGRAVAWCLEMHPLLMVGTDPVEVDGLLAEGRLRCPGCMGRLGSWGRARPRSVRAEHGPVRHHPRRARCSGCGRTHVLLAASMLARRADDVAVIGAALLAKAAGAGHRTVAAGVDRPASTVRGWLRRFGRRAEQLRVLFTGVLHALDPAAGSLLPTGSGASDALAAMGAAAAAAVRLFGPRCPWQFASAASGGLLLGPVAL
jgi:transposase-like protein